MPASSNSAWFAPEARERITAAVRRVEATTSAELVISVRAASDDDPATRQQLAAGLAALALLVYLFWPVTFPDDLGVLAIGLAYLLGLALGSTTAVRRALTPRARMDAAVAAAARSSFFDQSIASTRDRAGVLVFVSLLERRVELLLDTGVAASKLPATLQTTLERSLPDITAFEHALLTLASALAAAHPRQDDDTNELPDEVRHD